MFKVLTAAAILSFAMISSADAVAPSSAAGLAPIVKSDVVTVRAGRGGNAGHVRSSGRGRSYAARSGGHRRGYGGGRGRRYGYGGGYGGGYGFYDDFGYGGYGYGPCIWVGPVRVCP